MPYRKGLLLSWGHINVVVSVDGLKDKPESLTTVCCGPVTEHAPTQIATKNFCNTCVDPVTGDPGVIVSYADLKKAKKVGEDFVVVDQQEVATVRDSVLGATKKMMGVTVHPSEEVVQHTLPDSQAYLLIPEGAAQIGAYSLLVDTIQRHPELAFCTTWSPTSKPNYYRLAVYHNALTLQQITSPSLVRAVADLGVIEALPEHQAKIDSFLGSMVEPFDLDAYGDRYSDALDALLASKEAVAGIALEKAKGSVKAPSTPGGVDLMAALSAMADAVTA